MRNRLSKYDLPCPKFASSKNKDELLKIIDNYPLIVKPVDRSGSRGVTKVYDEFQLYKAIDRATQESFEKNVIIEEFISGKEYSVEMISWQGKHFFIQITEKETTGYPYYVEKGQHQPAIISTEKKMEIINLINKSLTALGVIYGASHSEIIINENGKVYIVEIGARMGGDYIGSHLVYLSTGYDFLRGVIEIALGKFSEIKLNYNYYSGVYFIIPEKGIVTEIIDNTDKYFEIVSSEISIKKKDVIDEIRESSKRPACFIYQSKNNKFNFSDSILKIKTYKQNEYTI